MGGKEDSNRAEIEEDLRKSRALVPDYDPESSFTLPLERPIKVGTTSWDSLTFRPMESGDMWGMPLRDEQQVLGHLFGAAASMCGVPPEVLKRLRAGDVGKVQAVTAMALAHFHATGSD